MPNFYIHMNAYHVQVVIKLTLKLLYLNFVAIFVCSLAQSP